ncbi:glycoside hydrolase domain-containing protein [Actinoplanes sp. NPDC048967]|uniref:glycoside hydrolase domain-containing protein n=1 Tax=Actinoplanes sp. NPDC048967 TaxID=3155269 RepID=UPI0033C07644
MRTMAPLHRKRVVRAAFGVAVILLSTLTLAQADATMSAGAAATVQPGTFSGKAFDACTAPSSATMAAWRKASPYRGIGIYVGGNNRGCTQKNLTAGWVRTQVAAGWHLIPLYVGPQASCTTTKKKNLISNTKAAAQGATAAQDAVVQARALGLAAQSVLIYDMEAYRTNDAACRKGVLAFMSAWTAKLHDLGYLSGFYSSMGSGVADQVANYAAPGYVRPDYLDFARWDKVATLTDTGLPATHWSPHRRMKQYQGDHKETWGGVTINIDSNLVDFAPLPAAKLADHNGNGWSDVLARTSSTGNLFLYPGNGTYADEKTRKKLGSGWQTMNSIVRIGDLNRDGYPDVVARVAANGYLYFYPGRSSGSLGTRKLLSKDFKKMREITAIGDLNKDGYPDLVAAQTSNHHLYLYPGVKGTKLAGRKLIAKGGWDQRNELTGVGDFNRDGHPDLMVRQGKAGQLFLYPGRKGTLGARKQLGTGWNNKRDLLGVGDFDRDGYTDLVAVLKTPGSLMLYRGTGSGLRPGLRLATGYKGRSPLF